MVTKKNILTSRKTSVFDNKNNGAKCKTLNKTLKREKKPEKSYTVWDGTRGGKTFGTPEEAIAYSNECIKKSGEFFAVTSTTKKVTHTFKR